MVKGRVTKCALTAAILLFALSACSGGKSPSGTQTAATSRDNTIVQDIAVVLPTQRHAKLSSTSITALNDYQEALVRAGYARPVLYQYRDLAGDARNETAAEIIKTPPTQGQCEKSIGPIVTCKVVIGTMHIGGNTQTMATNADYVTTDCTPMPNNVGKFITRWISAPGYHNSEATPFEFGKTVHCIGHQQNGQITYKDPT